MGAVGRGGAGRQSGCRAGRRFGNTRAGGVSVGCPVGVATGKSSAADTHSASGARLAARKVTTPRRRGRIPGRRAADLTGARQAQPAATASREARRVEAVGREIFAAGRGGPRGRCWPGPAGRPAAVPKGGVLSGTSPVARVLRDGVPQRDASPWAVTAPVWRSCGWWVSGRPAARANRSLRSP